MRWTGVASADRLGGSLKRSEVGMVFIALDRHQRLDYRPPRRRPRWPRWKLPSVGEHLRGSIQALG